MNLDTERLHGIKTHLRSYGPAARLLLATLLSATLLLLLGMTAMLAAADGGEPQNRLLALLGEGCMLAAGLLMVAGCTSVWGRLIQARLRHIRCASCRS
jgi:hypothetical protein